MEYRTFRNTDPPRLVEVWNQAFTGRGAVRLANSTPLEQYVFAKPIFDPGGLLVADAGERLAGFAHAVISPCPETAAPVGVLCVIGVRPEFRRQGIGSELLRRAEVYLRERGAGILQAGPAWPHNPLYLGLYGGSDSPGFLQSEPLAEPFLLARGYQVQRRFLVFQKDLEMPAKIVDIRFANLRNRLEIAGSMPRRLPGWWQECILGFIEPVELRVEDRSDDKVLARTLVWEMEGFSHRWGGSAIGILRFEVEAEARRLGIGKFLLSHLLKQVREQFFKVAEVHLESTNDKAIRFVQSLDFQQVDLGQVYGRVG